MLRTVDEGHPFALERVHLSMPSVVRRQKQATKTVLYTFEGVVPPTSEYSQALQSANVGKFPAIPDSLGTDMYALWGLGSTAIARSIPNVPEFSLFRFIGELRSGMPKLPGASLAKERKLRNSGGEYLNLQFGVLPTVSDLQSFFDILQRPELRAAVKYQLHEEHRVRKTIERGTETTSRPLTALEMSTIPTSFSSGMRGTQTRTTSFEIWSSCSFAYYQVNSLDQLLTDLDRQLGGLGVVPEAIDIYNLVPWSWFVDWFTNFNHVITNLSYLGRDGLYLQRGYLMGHYRDVLTDRQERVLMDAPLSTVGVRTFERKYRVRASPFGFGYTWKDFDPFQLSILGALGVSRMRF